MQRNYYLESDSILYQPIYSCHIRLCSLGCFFFNYSLNFYLLWILYLGFWKLMIFFLWFYYVLYNLLLYFETLCVVCCPNLDEFSVCFKIFGCLSRFMIFVVSCMFLIASFFLSYSRFWVKDTKMSLFIF